MDDNIERLEIHVYAVKSEGQFNLEVSLDPNAELNPNNKRWMKEGVGYMSYPAPSQSELEQKWNAYMSTKMQELEAEYEEKKAKLEREG